MTSWEPIGPKADDDARADRYREVNEGIERMLAEEPDWIGAMATVVCELHHAFGYFDWTGFYRLVEPELLIVGPYQGTHGCLRIPFERGICGSAARQRKTEWVDDVTERSDHIACSSTTVSEVVIPVETPEGDLLAVLDVDSDTPAVFSAVDVHHLEELCGWLGERYGSGEAAKQRSGQV